MKNTKVRRVRKVRLKFVELPSVGPAVIPLDVCPHTGGVLLTSKVRAHKLVKRSMRTHGINPPKECLCGRAHIDGSALYAHHEDYSRPFHVAFVCRWCHIALHDQMRKRTSKLHPRLDGYQFGCS